MQALALTLLVDAVLGDVEAALSLLDVCGGVFVPGRGIREAGNASCVLTDGGCGRGFMIAVGVLLVMLLSSMTG